VYVRDGVIAIGRGTGRGAYLCPAQSCVQRALERRALQRVLRTEITPPDALVEAVSAQRSGDPPPAGC